MIKRRSSMKFRGVPSPLVLSSPSSGGTQRTSPSASLIREGAGPFFFKLIGSWCNILDHVQQRVPRGLLKSYLAIELSEAVTQNQLMARELPKSQRPVRRGARGAALTCSQQDDLVVQGQLGEVRDPLGPLHQGEELLVGRLANVRHRVIGLRREGD